MSEQNTEITELEKAMAICEKWAEFERLYPTPFAIRYGFAGPCPEQRTRKLFARLYTELHDIEVEYQCSKERALEIYIRTLVFKYQPLQEKQFVEMLGNERKEFADLIQQNPQIVYPLVFEFAHRPISFVKSSNKCCSELMAFAKSEELGFMLKEATRQIAEEQN